MADYVIRRNKIRMFFWWLVITGIAVVCSLLTLVYLVDGNLAQLDKWVGILLFAFVVITSTWASMAIAGQLVFGSSEFLRLTQEGFYYTGHGLGRKVYTASWQEVDRIFYTEIVHRGRYGVKSYSRFISVDFVQPERWQKQYPINQSNSKLVRSLTKHYKRTYKNGDLDMTLTLFTDHSDKQIHDVIDLMNQYHQQALIKEKKP